MRQLGATLGVDPMAIYYHVPSKGAVFDGIVELVWSKVSLPKEPGDWHDTLQLTMASLRTQLLAHPRAVPLVATRPVVTPQAMDLLDHGIALLTRAGLPAARAAALIDASVAYTIGAVLAEVREPAGGAGEADPHELYAALPAQRYPHLAAAMATGYGWDPQSSFETGLRALITGYPLD